MEDISSHYKKIKNKNVSTPHFPSPPTFLEHSIQPREFEGGDERGVHAVHLQDVHYLALAAAGEFPFPYGIVTQARDMKDSNFFQALRKLFINQYE